MISVTLGKLGQTPAAVKRTGLNNPSKEPALMVSAAHIVTTPSGLNGGQQFKDADG